MDTFFGAIPSIDKSQAFFAYFISIFGGGKPFVKTYCVYGKRDEIPNTTNPNQYANNLIYHITFTEIYTPHIYI